MTDTNWKLQEVLKRRNYEKKIGANFVFIFRWYSFEKVVILLHLFSMLYQPFNFSITCNPRPSHLLSFVFCCLSLVSVCFFKKNTCIFFLHVIFRSSFQTFSYTMSLFSQFQPKSPDKVNLNRASSPEHSSQTSSVSSNGFDICRWVNWLCVESQFWNTVAAII